MTSYIEPLLLNVHSATLGSRHCSITQKKKAVWYINNNSTQKIISRMNQKHNEM